MEHTYLLRPGRWRAEGTYYDETGCSFPLAGETELVQEGAERHLDGWMEVSGPAPVRFTNRYVIREPDRPFILSRYVSRDRVYSGCEVLTLQADGSYHNAGVSMKNGRRMSAWTAVLSEERGRT